MTYTEYMHAALYHLNIARDRASHYDARHAIIAAQSARIRANSAAKRSAAAEIIRCAERILGR